MHDDQNGGKVAEIQGLQGAFSFPEKLLQQIWARQEFIGQGLRALDGRAISVRWPGKWNRLAGPDFRDARLCIGDVLIEGDVEVHLRAADWAAHGHAKDPAYDNVMLHVVLFPGTERFTRGTQGREIPVVSLLEHLYHDLEEYAAEAAVERLANRSMDGYFEALARLPVEDVRKMLRACAARRWTEKVHFARQKISRLGWRAACHHTALEILGYRHNRAGMLRVAGALPLENWEAVITNKHERAHADWLETALAVGENQWSKQGVRPANLPRTRLKQYLDWCTASTDWPERLARAGLGMGAEKEGQRLGGASLVDETTAGFRRTHKINTLSKQLCVEITGGVVGGSRWDTLVCDGFWPLLAARYDSKQQAELQGYWLHWPMGDMPDSLVSLLRRLGLIGARDWPASHGAGQGGLGWIIDRERELAAPSL